MKQYLLALSLLFPGITYAQTDYQCVSDCTAKNYQYAYCQSKCSFDNSAPAVIGADPTIYNKIKQTDFQCVNDCTSKGYQYGYCTSHCSF